MIKYYIFYEYFRHVFINLNIEISNINWNSYLSSFDVFNSSPQDGESPINKASIILNPRYIGKEPSGSEGEALTLKDGKPHNPLIMTGGLAVSSLIKPTLLFSERFEYFQNKVLRFDIPLCNSIYRLSLICIVFDHF